MDISSPSTIWISALPLEILSIILRHLFDLCQPDDHRKNRSKLATYATVCRQWQSLIESRTFQRLALNPCNPNELSDFQAILAGRGRRNALEILSLEPVLPDYSVRSRRKYEREQDRQKNNAAFTHGIRSLLNILQSWEVLDGLDWVRPLNLQILAPYAPMDLYDHPDGPDPIDYETDSIGRGSRYRHSYLRLVGVDEDPLPAVRRITSFSFNNSFSTRQSEPSSAIAIAKCLPMLEKWDLEISDEEWRYPVMRRQHRLDFAHALTSFRLSSTKLNSFWLSHAMSIPLDHNFRIPSALHASSPTTDHLSIALYYLSQLPSLKRFSLDLQSNIVISPSLFWPDDPSIVTANRPIWLALEEIEVSAHPTTPTGDWYFEQDPLASPRSPPESPRGSSGPPSPSTFSRPHTPNSSTSSQPDNPLRYTEDELSGQRYEDVFRTKLCPTTFNPLALSFARAVTCMPKLRSFYFQIENVHPTKLVAEWAPAGGGAELDHLLEAEQENVNRWIIATDPGTRWDVPDEVMEVFREGVGLDGLVTFQELEV